jgi:cell division protein FtsB
MRTAAPSPAIAAGPTTGSRTTPARRRRARLTAHATILLSLMTIVLILSIAPAQMYFEQRAELRRMERRSEELTAENASLQGRADQLRDAAFLERLARQCLGMVEPGEIAFVVVPRKGAPAPPPEC